MPIIVTASPTSIRTVEDYMRKRSNRTDKAFFLVYTQLGTIPQNEGKMDWGKLTLTNLGNAAFKEDDGKPNDFARGIIAFQKSARAAHQAQVERAIAEATAGTE